MVAREIDGKEKKQKEKIIENNTVISNKKDIANILNHYCDITEKLLLKHNLSDAVNFI